MLLNDAQKIVADFLDPISYDDFFEKIISRKPLAVLGQNPAQRELLLGEDPKATILGEYSKYAQHLTCHIHTPTGPPPSPRAVESPEAFLKLIREYHQTGYTIRIPDVFEMAPRLSEFTRAMEVITEKPLGPVIFWSDNDARAPVHDDEVDVIIVQLYGQKRWYISSDEALLPNSWKPMGKERPEFDNYDTYDINPGDMLYLPRGTAHTVHSTSESIHLAIGFAPVTVRDSINAALDILSDYDKSFRQQIGTRADALSTGRDFDVIASQIRAGIEKLRLQCQSDKFIQQTFLHRRARAIYELPKESHMPSGQSAVITSRVKHHPLAIAEIAVTPTSVDFRQPGKTTLLHPGVEECMRFIKATPEFTVSDIPGEIDDEVRVALVNKLLGSGFLILAN